MTFTLGLGCDRGTPAATLAQAIDEALALAAATRADVAAAASIDLKADEACIQAVAAQNGWRLHFYRAAELVSVPVPNPSETVRHYTGTPSVSEAAALLAAGYNSQPAPMQALCVEKHKLRGPDGKNATVSVARIPPPPVFDAAARDALYAVLHARRDMRHFTSGAVVPPQVRQRLLAAAHAAPSVGLMQPWRFIRISDAALRERLAQCVDAERARTAQALGARGAAFMALKVEGVRECAELWAVVLAPDDATLFGRRTLPRQTVWCSAAAAVQNLWLAARAENLGLGWVSLFDPAELAALLALPAGAEPMGLLCIGPVPAFYEQPMLEQVGWRRGLPAAATLCENQWQFDER